MSYYHPGSTRAWEDMQEAEYRAGQAEIAATAAERDAVEAWQNIEDALDLIEGLYWLTSTPQTFAAFLDRHRPNWRQRSKESAAELAARVTGGGS